MKTEKWEVPFTPVPQGYRDTMDKVLSDLRTKSRALEGEEAWQECFLAHSKTNIHPLGHYLKRHLEDVANEAASFFEPLGASHSATPAESVLAQWARLIALYHDAGKYKLAFQRRVRGESSEWVDHATLGGRMLEEQYGLRGRLMAFVVMGHHGGMPNGVRCEHGRSLEQRLQEAPDEEAVAAFQREIPLEMSQPDAIDLRITKRTAGFELSMVLRMLFSALVDADYLDTERYFEPAHSALRGGRPEPSTLLPRYEQYMSRLKEQAQRDRTAASDVIKHRENVQAACLAAGALPQGFFSLTVPTGGGKTLASLGFALKHLKAHPRIKRVIYAIPFTSIIEQNAQIFRDALGDSAVLEHHSAARPPEDGTPGDRTTENWDAPLIVTTNVQLFESLYSNKPSRCRKLHNLRNSLIVLDEAQALPDAMLRPCLMALLSLVKNHGVTVLLCTATQPEWSAVWPEKPEIHEIVPDVEGLFAALRRTHTQFIGSLGDEALCARLEAHGRALCIVNARAHAQALYRALANREGVYHLSALMCPKHRSKVLDAVKKRLEDSGKPPCILITTSLVEAGVDIDFPVVYRALAGLDSVAQAAGRCNRGGLIEGLGQVCVFVPEVRWKMPPEIQRQGQRALTVAGKHRDLLSKSALDDYFRQRFGLAEELDQYKILEMIEAHRRDGLFAFEDIATSFEMIQSSGEPLVVPYDSAGQIVIEQLKNPNTVFEALRKAGEYTLSIYPKQRDALIEKKLISKVGDVWVLNVSEGQLETLYDEQCGLMVDKDPFLAERLG